MQNDYFLFARSCATQINFLLALCHMQGPCKGYSCKRKESRNHVSSLIENPEMFYSGCPFVWTAITVSLNIVI